MNRNIKNFKGLSLKQIKTYVIATIMSTFALDAVAHMSDEEANSIGTAEHLSEIPYEAGLEADLNLESWMTTSFELPGEERSATLVFDPTAYEMVIETELDIEDWMSTPFEVHMGETPAMKSDDCTTAP
jgi:hypothetical protein